MTAKAREVVGWLREGLRWKLFPLNTPEQQAAPFRRKKLRVVREMLARVLPEGSDVEEYLLGDEPHEVVFPNHNSLSKHAEFAKGEIKAMASKGVIQNWGAREPPRVVNGLLVVDEKFPKLRLCLNPSYPNLWF